MIIRLYLMQVMIMFAIDSLYYFVFKMINNLTILMAMTLLILPIALNVVMLYRVITIIKERNNG